ncbi:MAG: GAF domain-containing protein [Betaproteobacteria bacterium]|nr:GAF domain-containing protein [Betaproteobacteria bacterium]
MTAEKDKAPARGAWRAQENWTQHELLIIREMAKRLGASIDTAAVIRDMLHLLSELLGLNRGRVLLFDRAQEHLVITYAYGLTRAEIQRGRFRPGEGITGRVFLTRETLVVQDIDAEPAFLCRTVERARLPQETVAFIALPIDIGDQPAGVLGVHRLRQRDRAIADDLAILRMVATFIGQVLRISRLVAERTAALQHENRELRRALEQDAASVAQAVGIIGQSPHLLGVLRQIERFAASDVTALILGESGTGKEMLANAIHRRSARHDGPFIKVNCAAIPENLFEAELFGHERGAFTGANTKRLGRFDLANRGTIFLDEIGELSLGMQSKLLRVLQEKVIERVGGIGEHRVDVRIVAATNRDLQQMVAKGQFRLDLFYRLNVVPVYLPALRERPEDVRPLARHFLSHFNQKHGRNASFDDAVIAALERRPWPGNVRQLQNLIERAVLLHDGGKTIGGLIQHLLTEESILATAGVGTQEPMVAARPYRAVAESEREHIESALAQSRGNKSQAAQALGMSLRQLEYRIKRLAISPQAFRAR